MITGVILIIAAELVFNFSDKIMTIQHRTIGLLKKLLSSC